MFEQVTVTLMNSLGQKLEQQQYASTQEVDFAIQYKADLYFVQVTTNTGKSAVLKVVKN